MRGMAEAERETLQARSVELAQQIRVALLPKTPWTSATSCWKFAPARRRRGRAVRRRPVPDV